MIYYQNKLVFQSDLIGEEDTGTQFFKALKGNKEEWGGLNLFMFKAKNYDTWISI